MIREVETRRAGSGVEIEWERVPFTADDDWGGRSGEPATITPEKIILQAQDVQTKQVFSSPLTVECMASPQELIHADGYFELRFVEIGQRRNSYPRRAFEIFLQFNDQQPGNGVVFIHRCLAGPKHFDQPWDEHPFSAEHDQAIHLKIEVSKDGLRITV